MAKLVVSEFLSLDGVMQAPGGEPGFTHSGWVMRFPSPDQFKYKLDEVLTHDALLIDLVQQVSEFGLKVLWRECGQCANFLQSQVTGT